MKRHLWSWLLAAIGAATSASAAERPNIVLILADNWAWPHAGAYGDRVVKTPAFDRIAREGALFDHAFCSVPSCSAARAVLLTGQAAHRLGHGANLWGELPAKFPVYPDRLEAHGYAVGYAGKGWGPGNVEKSGRTRNPAGPEFESFDAFLETVPQGTPFCFWHGSRLPHRAWTEGRGELDRSLRNLVRVPPELPDVPEVRDDILDYYAEVQQFDAELARILAQLDARGLAKNTLLIVAGDNGWQMPRGLANLYDSGTRVPMAVRWPTSIEGGRKIDAFASFEDVAPTFLEAAGLEVPAEMTGRSLVALLGRRSEKGRDAVFLERERHANVRDGDRSYPARGVRTKQFLYIRNFQPELWPAGDPEVHWAVGPYGDVDPSVTKQWILDRRNETRSTKYYDLSFAKRQAEELYDLTRDPGQVENVAGLKE